MSEHHIFFYFSFFFLLVQVFQLQTQISSRPELFSSADADLGFAGIIFLQV